MEDDAISVLSFQDLEENPEVTALYYASSSFPSPSNQDAFEFSVTGVSAGNDPASLLCEKAIPSEKPGYVLQSDSYFERFRSSRTDARLARSGSLRSPSSRAVVPATGSCRHSPSFRRRYKALIGVTKFPSRVDMGEIRKRQNRQAPAPLFHVSSDSGGTAPAARGGRGNSTWGLLRCRPHLVSALARASLGCVRQV